MKKNDFWDYDKSNKASGHSLGSRLIRIFLIGGCFLASATIAASLFFYFYPAQAIRSAQAIQDFAEHLAEVIAPPEEQSLQSVSSPRNLQQTSVHHTSAAVSAADAAPAVIAAAETASVPQPEPQTSEPEIPLITFSSSQGDINQIGQSDAEIFLNDDYLVMLDSSMGPMLYYNQGDSRWSDYLYGDTDPISQYGCGPTVAAMLINAFTEYTVIPPNLADWAAINGYHSPHNGSRHGIIPGTLSAYGLHVESAAGADYDTAAELLRSGHVLVALMGKGTFSNDGHFIIITNILENGNVHIADCYNFENTKMEWDLNLLLSELKHSRDDGAPLWAVTYP